MKRSWSQQVHSISEDAVAPTRQRIAMSKRNGIKPTHAKLFKSLNIWGGKKKPRT
jgi:hypothetical protein